LRGHRSPDSVTGHDPGGPIAVILADGFCGPLGVEGFIEPKPPSPTSRSFWLPADGVVDVRPQGGGRRRRQAAERTAPNSGLATCRTWAIRSDRVRRRRRRATRAVREEFEEADTVPAVPLKLRGAVFLNHRAKNECDSSHHDGVRVRCLRARQSGRPTGSFHGWPISLRMGQGCPVPLLADRLRILRYDTAASAKRRYPSRARVLDRYYGRRPSPRSPMPSRRSSHCTCWVPRLGFSGPFGNTVPARGRATTCSFTWMSYPSPTPHRFHHRSLKRLPSGRSCAR